MGPLGWAAFEPGGVRVWGEDVTTAIAGVRLLLARAFPPPKFLLVHGVGLELGGRGLLATGPSGAGKSTLCGLFEEATPFSDEVILLETGPRPKIHATPIRSSCERAPVGGSAPLIALLALEKAAEPALRPLRAAEALALLLEQTFEHPEPDLSATFAGAASVVEAVERRVLAFRKDRSCVPLLRELLGA